MNSHDLIRIAKQLASGAVGGNRGRPRQAELRRAVSTAYYALFHTLARCGADLLGGATRATRSQPAWRQIYRALEHGHAKNQCDRPMMSRFPAEIRKFGESFAVMQRQRHAADYDPEANFSRSDVLQLIDETERAITQFENAATRDRRAFAIYVLFKFRPH